MWPVVMSENVILVAQVVQILQQNQHIQCELRRGALQALVQTRFGGRAARRERETDTHTHTEREREREAQHSQSICRGRARLAHPEVLTQLVSCT